MSSSKDIDKLCITDEIFKDNLVINKNLEKLKYYIELFFVGIMLDVKLEKSLGYHFFNEIIPSEYDIEKKFFVQIESLCKYKINELQILLIHYSKEEALNKFFHENNDLKNIKNELSIFLDMMYLINNHKN